MLESIRYVDEVIILNSQEDKFNYLKENQVDFFAIGSDYIGYRDIKDIEKYTKVVFIERTKDISSTEIRKKLLNSFEYKTFVIDIDDTICTTINRDFENSIPHTKVINKINSLYDNGWKIILFTARGAKSCHTLEERKQKYEELTSKWLQKNNVHYTSLLFGKENADFYVDDKSMSIEEFLDF